jgi:hypothetical protein
VSSLFIFCHLPLCFPVFLHSFNWKFFTWFWVCVIVSREISLYSWRLLFLKEIQYWDIRERLLDRYFWI